MAWLVAVICVAGFGMAAEAGAGELDSAVKQAAVVMVDTSAAGLSESVADSIRSWSTRQFADIRGPVFTPRRDVNYTIRVVTPDPTIDYKILAVRLGTPRLNYPGTPFIPYPNTPFKPFKWKIPDFKLFPHK